MENKQNKIDLVKIIKENHIAIKNGTYEWQDDEVEAVTSLAYSILQNYKLPKDISKPDIIQNMLLDFFGSAVKKVDVNNFVSSYVYTCLKNNFLQQMYFYNTEKRRYPTIKFDKIDSENPDDKVLDYCDVYKSSSLSPSEEYEKNILKKQQLFVLEQIKKTKYFKQVFFDGKTQIQLSKEINNAHSMMTYLIKKEKDTIMLECMERGIPYQLINNKLKETPEIIKLNKNLTKNGILHLVYNQRISTSAIAKTLNAHNETITKFIKNKKAEKVEVLNKKGINNAEMLLNFTEAAFPEFLYKIEKLDNTYFKYAEKFINKNKLLYLKFKENKTNNEISEMLGTINTAYKVKTSINIAQQNINYYLNKTKNENKTLKK